MLHYALYEDIAGEAYNRLISYALERSDAFLLVYFSYGQSSKMKSEARKIHDELKPLKIRTRYDPAWPNTISMDESNTYKVVFYRSEPEAGPVLRSAESLFSWNYPRPMDLCFFSEGRCWLSTTAHEEFADFYFKTEDEAREIIGIGIPIEFCGEISPEGVYYEDY